MPANVSEMSVKLETEELVFLEYVTAARQASNLGRPDRFGTPDRYDKRDMHHLGAAGEYVAALVLGLPWRPVCNPQRMTHGDVGTTGNVQVRTTTARADGMFGTESSHLIALERDPVGCVYVLVVRESLRSFTVAGVCTSEFARRSEFWRPGRNRPGAYWVPADKLENRPAHAKRLVRLNVDGPTADVLEVSYR